MDHSVILNKHGSVKIRGNQEAHKEHSLLGKTVLSKDLAVSG